MARTEAENRAIQKYEREKVERIVFRVAKGKKEQMQNHATRQGESLSAFLNRAVKETIERDKQKGNREE